MWTRRSMNSLSRSSRPPRSCPSLILLPSALELQPAFASGFRQGFDPAVITIGAAIEDDLADAGLRPALGDQAPDRRCRLGGSAVAHVALHVLVHRRGC